MPLNNKQQLNSKSEDKAKPDTKLPVSQSQLIEKGTKEGKIQTPELSASSMDGYNRLRNAYDRIKQIILKEKDVAKKRNKFLLILIGEAHNQLYGSFVEAIIIMISSFWANVNNLMLELDESRFNPQDLLIRFASMYISFLRRLGALVDGERFIGMQSLSALSDNLGGETHLIDDDESIVNHSQFEDLKLVHISFFLSVVPNCLLSYMPYLDTFDKRISPEGMRNRNQRMRDHLVEKQCDAVCVVGGAHLYGLINETDLNDIFHTVVFSTAEQSIPVNGHLSPSGIKNMEFFIHAHSPIVESKSFLDPDLVNKGLIDFKMLQMLHEQETKLQHENLAQSISSEESSRLSSRKRRADENDHSAAADLSTNKHSGQPPNKRFRRDS